MSLKNYFEIYTKNTLLASAPPVSNGPKAVFQWLALLIGVLIQPFFSYYKENGNIDDWSAAYKNWEFIIFAVIVAIIVFPAIYRKAFDSDRPAWIQLIPIFTAGLGWQTLVDSAISGATKKGNPDITGVVNEIAELLFFLV